MLSQTPWGIAPKDGMVRSELDHFQTAPTAVCKARSTSRIDKSTFTFSLLTLRF
jgi:hypothetical protein